MAKNKIIPYEPKLKTLARNLRKNMTHAEVLLWQKIRNKSLDYQFHRQIPMLKYIVDFYCHELMLAIEVDGKVHEHPKVSVSDLDRQQELEIYGVQFLRFENEEIKQDIDSVVSIIENWIKQNT
ncbi:endonuclease domain-containing protein [Fodinibius salsisoli]|uniref:Endonuclease domain-containing protein n=1 Tax=Fodinibius salsisoli TaxID=2820877 RepID=A0ABT3PSD5_9BACT|nr:endonuclease domain-containing protein [Fodinibius salsisoli]